LTDKSFVYYLYNVTYVYAEVVRGMDEVERRAKGGERVEL
jgi:hypothetical protein